MYKKILCLLAIGGIMLCSCSCESSEETEEISLKDNQTLCYGQIVEIKGNEVTLAWATALSSADVEAESGNSNSGAGNRNDGFMSGEMPSMSEEMSSVADNGEKSSESDREMPSVSDGEMPSMSDDRNSGRGQMGNASSDGKMQEERTTEETTVYTLTGEEDTMLIPVGTSVVTELGAATTFSRLADGDMLKIVLETNDDGEEVIVGIWIAE